MSSRQRGDRTSLILRSDAQNEGGARPDSPSTGSALAASLSLAGLPAIEGYQILGELHRGGQGVVFRALQVGTKRTVALKVLLEDALAGESALRRFEREVELAASLRHPNIVTILDSGISHGRYFLVMEFIDGIRLDDFIKQHKPKVGELLLLFIGICEAVNYAHQHGVIHRDLKPSNILIDEAGEPHIMDFGLAKSQRASSPHETTVKLLSLTGQVVGTLAYMSPEQAAGQNDVDVRTDVYSLGVLLYELLVGRSPYSVHGPLADVLNRIAREDPVLPRQHRSTAPYGRYLDDELSTILLKCLEKDPGRRYQTAGDLARDLQLYLTGQPIEAKRASGLYLVRKTLQRHGLEVGFVSVLLAIMLGALGMYVSLYHSERLARAQADALQVIAFQRAEQARAATDRAEANAKELSRALIEQSVQRGEQALARGSLSDARRSFWDAAGTAADNPRAQWGLRRYFMESGERSALQATCVPDAPIGISCDGDRIAACEIPNAISLRDGESGRVLNWFCAPADVQALSVCPDGRVTAAGDYWVGVWPPGDTSQPLFFDGPAKPLAVLWLRNPASVLVLGQRRALVIDARTGVAVSGLPLSGKLLAGRCACAASAGSGTATNVVALVTESGVQVLSVTARGDWQLLPVAAADGIRGACFGPDGALWLLGAGVERRSGRDWSEKTVELPAPQAAEYDLITVGADHETWLADRFGHVSQLQHGAIRGTHRIANEALRWIGIPADQAGVATLDSQGELSVWDFSLHPVQRDCQPDRPWLASCTADSGQVAALSSNGEILQYQPGLAAGAVVAQLPLPEPNLALGDRRVPAELRTARHGNTLLARIGQRAWLVFPNAGTLVPLVHTESSAVQAACLAPDGDAVAMLRSAPYGDETELVIGRVNFAGGLEKLETIGRYPNGALRDLDFSAGTDRLLLARTNGALTWIPTFSNPSGAPKNREESTLAIIGAAPQRVFVNQSAELVLVVSEDSVVRTLSLNTGAEMGRYNCRRMPEAIAIDPSDSVVALANRADVIEIAELSSLKPLAEWKPVAPPSPPLRIAWSGSNQDFLINGADAVRLQSIRATDQQIALSKPRARDSAVAQRLEAKDIHSAREVAGSADLAPPSREARLTVLEQALAREYWRLPEGWLAEFLSDSDPVAATRLGLAAFDGGRFAEADLLWQHAFATPADADAQIECRWADCWYLLDRPEPALRVWGAQIHNGRLPYPQQARLGLKRLAVLLAVGHTDAAAEALAEIERTHAPTASMQELKAETVAAARSLIAGWKEVPERSNSIPDGMRSWIQAERLRAAGDARGAQRLYQRCIDSAAPRWLQHWARFRLQQVAPRDF